MLNILHSKINNIVPIIGIIENNNQYEIEYEDSQSVTSEQQTLINQILLSWPLDSAKLLKLDILNQQWNDQIQSGWLTPYGWKLGLGTNDITLLTGAFLLSKEAASLGLSQEANIVDIDGVSHTININDLTLLMIQYGQYRSSLSATYAASKLSIEQATSIQDLNNIP